ncbi:uncharacterized protein AC631_05359 [Debaryomyces fabryi]|uniref:Uncharacterized protein n=1 Tax=Debaryomyces fabryi TaxID=58627 RepID=A0A0V1PRM6_9ASCO|nr:uncharacterized protein AC631_05359 [Debaryomyces fabryi]KRZ98887.1 hypothetical protein AC631_05359 [Debaryomyces fabryi]CUM46624.1 unnamed protein product [Debaryomyces fabryi]
MGRFSDLKNKLADARDTVHIKLLEAQLDRKEKQAEKFEKTKQDFLAELARLAQKSGQPATVFEEGKWYTLYPDGRKEPMGGESSG